MCVCVCVCVFLFVSCLNAACLSYVAVSHASRDVAIQQDDGNEDCDLETVPASDDNDSDDGDDLSFLSAQAEAMRQRPVSRQQRTDDSIAVPGTSGQLQSDIGHVERECIVTTKDNSRWSSVPPSASAGRASA